MGGARGPGDTTIPFELKPDGGQGAAAGSGDAGNRPAGATFKATQNPLAQAAAALKKLRANPSDKEAANALERALQQLKEREKGAAHP
jgi:hypothetical protein